MSDNPFEIPQPIRDMADQNMKQAHAAYEQLTNFVAQTMHSWMGAVPSNPMTSGFKDVQDRAMDSAKDNAESAFSFAGKICNAQTTLTDHPRDFAHSNTVRSRPDAGLRPAYARALRPARRSVPETEPRLISASAIIQMSGKKQSS